MVATTAVTSADGRMEGVQMGDDLVLFGRDGTVEPSGTITYNVTGGTQITHLLVDLEPGQTYDVVINGVAADRTADAQGTITFTTGTATVFPPTIANVSEDDIVENAGTQTINLNGIGLGSGHDPVTETLTITATSNNHAVVPDPSVTYGGGTTGTLAFTPVAGATGTALITITLQDSGGTTDPDENITTESFVVKVSASASANQPPTFTAGQDQTVFENSGAQTIPHWVTHISPGPASESNQTLTFLVSVDDRGLFAAGPAISPTGTLTYTPAANATGTAHVTVTLKDNGGTANGGRDTSAPQRFSIAVSAPTTQLPRLSVPGVAAVQGNALPAGAPVATFTDPGHQDPGRYTATVDFGDGTAAVSGIVVLDSTGTFHVTASHTYIIPGNFTITTTLVDSTLGEVTASGTARVAAVSPGLSGGLAGGRSGGFVDTSNPTFAGIAPPGYTIQVFTGGGTVFLGQTQADASGRWTITTTSPLADGISAITATALDPAGVRILDAALGSVVVSTAHPRVSGLSLDPRTGRLTITFTDGVAGIDPGILSEPAAYDVSRVAAHGLLAHLSITGVSAASPLQEVLTLNGGRRLASGRYRLLLSSGGFADRAGNALDGEFSGSFPSGDGASGGDFTAEIDVKGRKAGSPRTFDPPVPKGRKGKPHSVPAGPAHLFAVSHRHGR
jgi:hypothetical protein